MTLHFPWLRSPLAGGAAHTDFCPALPHALRQTGGHSCLKPRFKKGPPQFRTFLAMSPWASSLTSQGFCTVICHLGIILVPYLSSGVDTNKIAYIEKLIHHLTSETRCVL